MVVEILESPVVGRRSTVALIALATAVSFALAGAKQQRRPLAATDVELIAELVRLEEHSNV